MITFPRNSTIWLTFPLFSDYVICERSISQNLLIVRSQTLVLDGFVENSLGCLELGEADGNPGNRWRCAPDSIYVLLGQCHICKILSDLTSLSRAWVARIRDKARLRLEGQCPISRLKCYMHQCESQKCDISTEFVSFISTNEINPKNHQPTKRNLD